MGYLRLALALAVAVNHLSWSLLQFAGPIAVFGFYTVSGYLVSGAIRDSYQGRPFAFLFNRTLRIYPAYWVVMLLGLGVALFGTPLSPAITIPQDFGDWWRQVLILGLVGPDGVSHPVRLVPPAWSLSIELFWYLGLVVLWKHSLPWLVVCTAAALAFGVLRDWEAAYHQYLVPGACFALGTFCQQRRLSLPRWNLFPAVALLGVLLAMGNFVQPSVWLMYAAAPATAYLIVSLPSTRSRGVEKFAGELAYPVFLCHWSVASIFGIEPGSITTLAVSLPLILLVSVGLVFLIEHPIARLRNAVRAR